MATFGPTEIANTNDDCGYTDGGFVQLTGLDADGNQFGEIGGKIHLAFRFQNVTIPNGATIDSAFLKVTKNFPSSAVAITAAVHALDADNVTHFNEGAGGTSPDETAKTAASVSWNIVGGTGNGRLTSPDIAIVIKEIVDRGGWSSGNALAVVWYVSVAADDNQIEDFSTAAGGEIATLEIDYTVGGVTHDVSAADAIKLSDTSIASLIIQGLSSDAIQLSDIPAGSLTIAVIAADGVDFSDAPIAEGVLSVSVADGIDLSDISTAEAILSLSAADGIKLSDTSTAGGLISVSVADGIDLSDAAIAERILSLLVADGIKISDSSAGIFNFSVTVADGLVLSDAITTILNLLVSVSDGIELSDISTDVSVAVSGKMIVTISSKSARIRFEGKMPNVDLTSKKPRIKFEGV